VSDLSDPRDRPRGTRPTDGSDRRHALRGDDRARQRADCTRHPKHSANYDDPISRLATPLSRRRFLRGAAALAAALPVASLAAACGGDDENGERSAATATTATPATPPATAEPAGASSPVSSHSTGDGSWSFTDDLGVTITLPQRPTRIVAYVATGAALWDFGVRPAGVYGTTVRPDGTREITTGSIDLESVVSLGEVYGTLDLEQLVALKPDLIVADLWTDTLDLWGLDEGASAQVAAIAPIVAIRYIDLPVSELIGRIGEVATALGADPDVPEVVAARAEFDRASANLEEAIAAKPGLTAVFVAGWQEALYIANPRSWADLIYFGDLGLEIVMPEALDEGYPIWQTLSWEQAGKYPADMALQDARAGAPTIDELNEFPTWAAHPAAKASQVYPWRTEYVASYQGVTIVLDDLRTHVDAARADVI